MQLINSQPIMINRDKVNQKMIDSYDDATANTYRANDERDIATKASKEILTYLRQLTFEFPNKINALDVGCGTGRFFHGLKHVNELTGIDISQPMLDAAKHPIHENNMDVERVKLLCGDYLELDLPKQGFDFIYSVGVFGHPAPINVETVNRFYDHLAPGGKLFFTIANQEDPKYNKIFEKSALRLAIEHIFSYLPRSLQTLLNQRWQNFFINEQEMSDLFAESKFSYYRTWPMINRFIACEAIKE